MDALKLYPVGIQTFEEIVRRNLLYIDKTEYIYRMTHSGGKYFFLSRPRRFGKSLLASTFQSYFEGKKDLFKGLAIEKLEQEWTEYPVLHFDMSGGKHMEKKELEEYLGYQLAKKEATYGITTPQNGANNRLTDLIQTAYRKTGKQVVVLIDEYDAPLLHTYETGHHDACREIYRNFFTGLKDYGYCIKCVFITGITKFTQIGMFGMLNTLVNISFSNEYATICGFTKDEVMYYFSELLLRMADSVAVMPDELMDTMSTFYGGYHFSRSLIGVYNPFSVCNALANLRLNSYWIASGSNEMLLKVLRKFINEIPELDNCLIDSDYLEMSDVNMDDPKLFLYQSGSLTIKKVVGSSYMLGYPNREVRNVIFGMILPNS